MPAEVAAQLRQDRTSGAWVIVAPQRAHRPQKKRDAGDRPTPRPRFDPHCPFCPGNEAQLPAIVAEVSAEGGPGWHVRVVPNKFPAVQMDGDGRSPGGGHEACPARGVHQVIIESPWHDADLALMDAGGLRAVVTAYRDRSRVLLDGDAIETAILFRNYGRRAGASLEHPHAQIIALATVPPRVAAMSEWIGRYHRENGRCVMCDELAAERQDGARVVDENNAFTAMVPFAAEHPFELWIVPRRHQASFTALDDNEVPLFADILGRVLRRLRAARDDPPYNFVVDTAPKGALGSPHWHWKLRIAPEIAISGGFELGGDLPINPSSPEHDAQLLRAATADRVTR